MRMLWWAAVMQLPWKQCDVPHFHPLTPSVKAILRCGHWVLCRGDLHTGQLVGLLWLGVEKIDFVEF